MDARRAAYRSAAFRAACGPLRTPRTAHGQRDLFFVDRVVVRLFTELHRFHYFARALRHRHGWRMGRRRVARDGGSAGALARRAQRDSAVWLFDRLPPCRCCRTFPLAALGMAPDVLDWRATCAAGALYPDESAGIGSMEATSCSEHCSGPARCCG